MAQWFLSADDYAVGADISETPFFNPMGIEFSIVDDGGRTAFRLFCPSGGRRTIGISHPIDLTGVCELRVLRRGVPADGIDDHFMFFANGAGGSNESGISLGVATRLVGTYLIALLTPSFSTLASTPYSISEGQQPHNSLLVTDGQSDHSLYLWDEGSTRPGTPQIVNNQSVGMTGNFLTYLSAISGNESLVYEIALGTDGDPAPTGPVTPTQRRSSPLMWGAF